MAMKAIKMADDFVKIKNVLISCYDKTGLKYFAAGLVKINLEIKIFSSSGTYRELEAVAKNNLVDISSYTGASEMPGGLVKTLHPKIHAGILADLNDDAQRKYLKDNKIEAFDMVAVNLYPFEKAVKEGKGFSHARNNIDIGGVSLLEAASKNFLRVTVVSSPDDYATALESIRKNNGSTDIATRLKLAKKAISHLQHYLTEINNYFKNLEAGDIK